MAIEAPRNDKDAAAALKAMVDQAEKLRARQQQQRVQEAAASTFESQVSNRRGGGNPLFVDIFA